MSLLEYEITISPPAPSFQISLDSMDASSITIIVDKVGPFTVHLSPSGDFPQKMLSSIAYPVAALIASIAPGKIESNLEGTKHTKDFDQPIGFSFSVRGVAIKVQPQTLKFSAFNGMAMATGPVTVS